MTPREANLTHDRLCEVLSYDPTTGELRWKVRTSNRVHVGDLAGWISIPGYRIISVDGIMYMAHRLAWFHYHGRWPPEETDHINLIRHDNRLDNLREATRVENGRNLPRMCRNTSGFKGVHKHMNYFRARIKVDGRHVHLGLFTTPQEAHAAYVAASEKYHGNFGRPS